ncbi:MAG TPA: 5'-3' exonuclease H3TH domain-containing protein, partial [Polyangiales bacterium]|nr:5'-3' exonuclease H3TH domain-containing protein [Polyangiales bacterium]
MTDRVVVALATNLLTRGALIATPGRTSQDGAPAHVRFAITRALLQAVSFKTPSYAVAVFDAEVPELVPALRAELEQLPALFTGLGFQCVVASRPADVVAAYTHAALSARHDVVVVGSDKRLAQLVQDGVWWYDAYKDVRYTPELVRKRFDVGPEHVSDWLAMVGDEDTLPGVKGLGKKSATQLIGEYGSIAGALDAVASIEGR